MNKSIPLWVLLCVPYTVFAVGVVEDGKLNINFTNMYINNKFDTPVKNSTTGRYSKRNEEWAQGYNFLYRSGYTKGPIGLGFDVGVNGGIKLSGNADHHTGGTMIPTGGANGSGARNWARAGAAVKIKISKTEIKYGNNLQYRLPVVISNNARVTPQYFQGVNITSKDINHAVINAGYLTRVVGRWSTDRTGLAIAGGTKSSDGFYFSGLDYQLTPHISAQYYISQLQDYYTQNYVGAKWNIPLTSDSSFETEGRYFNSRSSGRNGETGYKASGYTKNNDGKIDNNTWSLTGTYRLGYQTFVAGYQNVSDGSLMPSLNQASLQGKEASGVNYYLYTDRMFYNFTRAGEKTTYGLYSFDLSGINMPGWVFKLAYFKGTDIRQRGSASAKEFERDISLAYKFQTGVLKGLGVEWRNGLSKTNNHYDNTTGNNRNWVILTYTMQF